MSSFGDIIQKNRGYESFQEKEKEIEARSKNRVNRFWLKPGTGTKIIFLDDDPPILEEHQLKLNGDWRNWFTCRRVLNEPCLMCDELKDTPSTVGFFTVMDLSEYTDKAGNTHKNTIKLFAPKFKALQVIKRASQKRGGLSLWVVDVFRTNADSFNVGDVFDFEEKTDWDSIKALNPEAAIFNYAELLAPKTNADLKRILNRNTASVADVDAVAEEEVDF